MVAESSQVGAFNVGRDDECVTMELVAVIAKDITNSKSEIVLVDAPSNQVLVKRLRTDRLRALGWEPTVQIAAGMYMTYQAMLADGSL